MPPVGEPAAANGAPPVRQFCRLTPAEQLERRRQGLCFNCDEPYIRGHVCPRLFYLESDDYIDDGLGDAAAMDDVANPVAPDTQEPAAANAFMVSLHALAGMRTDNTMLLPMMVKGERLLALLDTGSTHNFLHGATMRRLRLASTGGEQLRVTVVDGDRLPRALLATCPSASARSPFPSRVSDWTWAVSTSSSTSTTYGPSDPSCGISRP